MGAIHTNVASVIKVPVDDVLASRRAISSVPGKIRAAAGVLPPGVSPGVSSAKFTMEEPGLAPVVVDLGL